MTAVGHHSDAPPIPVRGRPAGATRLADQLPRVLARDHFVRGYVGLCGEIWSTVVERLDDLEWFLDVGTAPMPFVRWLDGWLGVTVDPHLPEERQRALVRTAGQTLPWRGTRRRLEALLAALTGGDVDIADDGGVATGDDPPRSSQHVTVRLSTAGGLSEAHLLEIVRSEVPANAIVDLSIDAQSIASPGVDGDDDGGVVAEPEPYGDEGFLPPMRGGLDTPDDGQW